MITMRSLCLLLSMGILAIGVGGCAVLEQFLASSPHPDAAIRGITPGKLEFDSVELLVDVEVTNPYPAALPLSALKYNLTSGGTPMLSGEKGDLKSIPANGSGMVQVPVLVRFKDVLALTEKIKPGTMVPYELDLELGANVPGAGLVTLPMARSGEFPLPLPPTIEVGTFSMDKLGLDEMAGRLQLNVRNPNEFPLTLAAFDYALGLAGKSVAKGKLPAELRLEPGVASAVELPVSFKPRDLGFAGISMVQKKESDYTLGGTLQLDTDFGPLVKDFETKGRLGLGKP